MSKVPTIKQAIKQASSKQAIKQASKQVAISKSQKVRENGVVLENNGKGNGKGNENIHRSTC